jgi:DNA modification methylase
LMQRAIANSSKPGDLVLDLFAGSGSTLIACERTGRVCTGVEIDPIYADVILARWERFSGGTAERIDD